MQDHAWGVPPPPGLCNSPLLSLHHHICKMKRTPACLSGSHPSMGVFPQPHRSNMHLPPRAPNKVGQRRSKEKGSGLVEALGHGSPKSPRPTPGAGPQTEPQQEVREGVSAQGPPESKRGAWGLGCFRKAALCSQVSSGAPLLSFLGPYNLVRCLHPGFPS